MSFTAPVFTNAGIQLQLRALSGDPLTFTKIGIGDGEISGAIATMTALSNQIIAVDISTAKRTDKTFTVGGTFTNVGLDGFWWREVGLFAANPDYPDDRSKDILYCYQNAFTLAEYIASGSSTVIEKMIRISAAVGNAENVTAVIDSSTVYLTMDDLESILENYATTTQLTEGLSGKAAKNHIHPASDVTGLAAVATSGKYSDLSGKPTSLPANGGNADTIGSKRAVDIMNMGNFAANRTLISENTDLDTMLTGGKYVVNSKATAETINNSPFTENGYYFDVVRASSTNVLQIATLWTGKTKIRSFGGVWNEWVNINDGGNAAKVNGHTVNADVPENAVFTDTTYVAATESVSGLVSTGNQSFAGEKFVKAARIGLRMAGITKGTAPTSTQIAHIQFNDNSGENADSASVGQIYQQVLNTGASILTLQATDAMTAGGTNRTTLALVYDTDNCYVNVSAPSSPARSCLRNLSSGTSAATTSNCPSGAWYGKHA